MAINTAKAAIVTETAAELLSRVDLASAGHYYRVTRPDGTIAHTWGGSPMRARAAVAEYDGYEAEIVDGKALLAEMKKAVSDKVLADTAPATVAETPAPAVS